jgi:hypothetical protein
VLVATTLVGCVGSGTSKTVTVTTTKSTDSNTSQAATTTSAAALSAYLASFKTVRSPFLTRYNAAIRQLNDANLSKTPDATWKRAAAVYTKLGKLLAAQAIKIGNIPPPARVKAAQHAYVLALVPYSTDAAALAKALHKNNVGAANNAARALVNARGTANTQLLKWRTAMLVAAAGAGIPLPDWVKSVGQ